MEGAPYLLLLEPEPKLEKEMEDTALGQPGRVGKRAMDHEASENK